MNMFRKCLIAILVWLEEYTFEPTALFCGHALEPCMDVFLFLFITRVLPRARPNCMDGIAAAYIFNVQGSESRFTSL